MNQDSQIKREWSKRISWCLVAASLIMGVSACETVQTTQAGTVGITRTQQMAVSAQEIEQGSAQQYRSMVAGRTEAGPLSRDQAMTNRVRGISQRLIAQVGVFRPDAARWNWEVNVFDNKEVNAFCMAGGKIGVMSGLVTQLQATDDELAAVIGHEIAHALREHVREQVSDQMTASMGLQIAGALAAKNASAAQAVQQMGPMIAQTTFTLPRSRTAEMEADRMGLELAARAGYNPRGAISLWQKMGRLGGARPPEFMSTHPSPETRMQDLEATSRVVEPLYRTVRR